MPGSREWEQVICLEFIGIIWTPCLVFEVQENTEFHLSSSWKILCKSVWNCLLTSFHTHTDSVWFSILFFNNVFLPEAADFKPFYFRAVRLPTSWKNRKTLLSGTRLPLPAHHPYRLNSNHDLVWQCPQCQPDDPSKWNPSTHWRQNYLPLYICPLTKNFKASSKNQKVKSPSIDNFLLASIATAKMVPVTHLPTFWFKGQRG